MQYMQKGYVPIAYAPQESTRVQNVLVIILPVLKQSFNTGLNSAAQKQKMACQ